MANEPNPLESLDAAFDLPEVVCDDPDLRGLYEVIVARMRKEAEYLPMNTVQQLLIERIAFNYVVLRMRERAPVGTAEGFTTATVQRDYNTFWLAMTKEFNALLDRTNKDAREGILAEVRDLVLTTLSSVTDPKMRQELMIKFADTFEQAGL